MIRRLVQLADAMRDGLIITPYCHGHPDEPRRDDAAEPAAKRPRPAAEADRAIIVEFTECEEM